MLATQSDSTDSLIVMIVRREGRVQDARIRIDAHEARALHPQIAQQHIEIRSHETVQPLLVIDHVVRLLVELGNDLGTGRSLDVVFIDGGCTLGRQAVLVILDGGDGAQNGADIPSLPRPGIILYVSFT